MTSSRPARVVTPAALVLAALAGGPCYPYQINRAIQQGTGFPVEDLDSTLDALIRAGFVALGGGLFQLTDAGRTQLRRWAATCNWVVVQVHAADDVGRHGGTR